MMNKTKNCIRWLRAQGLTPLIIFLLTASSTGAFFIRFVPYMWAADGGAHVARTFQVADGQWTPVYFNHNPGDGYGGYIPKSVDLLRYQQLGIISRIDSPQTEKLTKDQTKRDVASTAELANQKISSEKVRVSFVNTAAYSPLAYAPQAVGVKIGMATNANVGDAITLGRILGFIVFIFCVGYSLFSLRRLRAKWLLFVVSLLPLTVFQASLITADSMLYSVLLLFSALIIKSLTKGSKLTKIDKALLIICTLLIPLVKTVYFPLAALILAVPKRHWATHRRYWIFSLASIVGSAAGFLYWTYVTGDISVSNGLVRADTLWQYGDAEIQKNNLLSDPLGYVKVLIDSVLFKSKFYVDTTFGYLGFNYMPIPGVAQLSGFFALGLATLIMDVNGKKNKVQAALILLSCAATVLIIFTALYVGFTIPNFPVVEGVQGRYFLPMFVLVLGSLALLVPRFRIQMHATIVPQITLVVLSLSALLISTVKYAYVINVV